MPKRSDQNKRTNQGRENGRLFMRDNLVNRDCVSDLYGTRRHFATAVASTVAGAIATSSIFADDQSGEDPGAAPESNGTEIEPRIYKAVKVSMIPREMPLLDQFRLAKDVGFDGISLFAPGSHYSAVEAIAAREETGLMIHNVNNSVHWKQRLSDPDQRVRAQSVDALMAAIRFAHEVGASSVLLVVGKVTDAENENHDQVWQRSIEGIRRALPLASKLGVRILCENVMNGFCETPQLWNQYLDEIGDPWVGAFFDIGNHQSMGGAVNWIAALGDRTVKLDVKGHDSTIQRNCDTFDGDVDWPAVRRELKELRFTGWATAEVPGGGRERLRQVVQDMDEALAIGKP